MKKILLLGVCFFTALGFSQTIAIQTFATGFSSPVAISKAPNDSRLFVVQQRGLIRILNSDGTVNATPFLNLTGTVSTSGSERGLLGLAFHPNYATNGFFYVNYTRASDGFTIIARYSVSADPQVANTTGTTLMVINQPASNHNGGSIQFGSDGYLYIGMGDGGGANDTSGYAQNLDLAQTNVAANPSRIYLGKMLRIDVNTTAPGLNYGFPPTNPFVSQPGKEEIWARGLRNPWKFTFNRLNGDLWIGDVGQNEVEEINKISSPLPNTGLNLGWRCYEGTAAFNTAGCDAIGTMTMPLTQYTHSGTGGCSITGGYFYTGSMYPNFQNKYFFADYCLNRIGYSTNAGAITYSSTFSGSNFFTTFGEDMNGELYIASATTVFKIIDPTLSTSEFEKSGFSIYPNPANEIVFIKSPTNIIASKIELFDVTGKLLLAKNAEATEENSILVADFAKGIYVVTVESTTGYRYTTKLVVE
jgi:glucose/arabinose dehydrogenase